MISSLALRTMGVIISAITQIQTTTLVAHKRPENIMPNNRTGDDRSPFLTNVLNQDSVSPVQNKTTNGNVSTSRTQGATASRHTAMSDNWRPSEEMVKLILSTICPNADYLNTQLISFTSHFHDQFNPNWDQQFKKWINNGWNVYGHKNNFSNTTANANNNKGFVDTYTDTSWADD